MNLNKNLILFFPLFMFCKNYRFRKNFPKLSKDGNFHSANVNFIFLTKINRGFLCSSTHPTPLTNLEKKRTFPQKSCKKKINTLSLVNFVKSHRQITMQTFRNVTNTRTTLFPFIYRLRPFDLRTRSLQFTIH